jgi:hypothetical protein
MENDLGQLSNSVPLETNKGGKSAMLPGNIAYGKNDS